MLQHVLRGPLLAAADNERLYRMVSNMSVGRAVVGRFVAGEGMDDAVAASAALIGRGLTVTIDHLGEDTTQRAGAESIADSYLALLQRLSDEGLTSGGRCEVSVKLSALGQKLPDGRAISTELAHRVCQAAATAGTTVTVDMEDHTTTDITLETVGELRREYPWVGAVLQSYLRRTEGDCRDLAGPGSRVRLCKGAYAEPASVAYPDKADVDRAFWRCLQILMDGQGYPMVATHDERFMGLAQAMARRAGRGPDSWELQMLNGIAGGLQRDYASQGHTVRVYLPYGTQWWGYLVRRLAERPANVLFFAKGLLGGS